MSDAPPLEYASPNTPIEPPKGAMAALFLIVLSDLLGFGIIIPSLPFYARDYHASDFQIGIMFAIYSLCQLVATPILGLASDRFGRRPVLLLSQIGSVAGYALLAVAMYKIWTPLVLGLGLVYLSRVIDGISGGNISTAQAYISDVTTPATRAKGMGMLGAAFGIGFALGPAVGGILAHFHQALPAVAAALASGVAAIMTAVRLPEPARHQTSEQSEAWLHPSRFKPIFENPRLVQLLGIWFFTMMAFVMLETCFAIFINDIFGLGELAVGLFFMFAGLVIIVVQGRMIGKWTNRFGEWKLVIVGPILVATALLTYVLVGLTVPTLAVGVGVMIFAGLCNATGRSLQGPTLSSLVSQNSDRRMQGTVFGFYHMLGSLARVIGPLIAAAIYTRHHTAPFLLAACMTAGIAIWTTVLHRNAAVAIEPVVG
jgi:DHA1 family tetracycline resistance protein-like MFS transporter